MTKPDWQEGNVDAAVAQGKFTHLIRGDLPGIGWGRTLAYLRAGVVENGKWRPTEEGVPQGGPLSPLLANIVLRDLDTELEQRGHKFVRYADDFLVLVKSE